MNKQRLNDKEKSMIKDLIDEKLDCITQHQRVKVVDFERQYGVNHLIILKDKLNE